MNTRRISRGAVIALATLSIAALSACGSGGDSEGVAATTSAQPLASPSATESSTPTQTTTPEPDTEATTTDRSNTEQRRSDSGEPKSSASPESERSSESERKNSPEEREQTSSARSTTTSENAQKASLPTTPGDYSEALMQAFTSGNGPQMRTYATDGVVAQLESAKIDGALLRTACEDDMCSYSTESGARVTLTLDTAKVDAGAAKAVTGVKISQ